MVAAAVTPKSCSFFRCARKHALIFFRQQQAQGVREVDRRDALAQVETQSPVGSESVGVRRMIDGVDSGVARYDLAVLHAEFPGRPRRLLRIAAQTEERR